MEILNPGTYLHDGKRPWIITDTRVKYVNEVRTVHSYVIRSLDSHGDIEVIHPRKETMNLLYTVISKADAHDGLTLHTAKYVHDDMYLCTTCGAGLPIERIDLPCDGAGVKPHDKRMVALGLVLNKWYPHGREHTFDNRENIASEIRLLLNKGRTNRWRNSVESWAKAVATGASPEEAHWALAQYAVWCTHASCNR